MTNVSNEDFVAFNQYNSQLSALIAQKNQLKMLIDSTNNAIEELTKSKEDKAYKNLGFVMLKVDKKDLVKDLEEEIEKLNIRIKTLDKSEDLITKKLKDIQTKLESNVKKE